MTLLRSTQRELFMFVFLATAIVSRRRRQGEGGRREEALLGEDEFAHGFRHGSLSLSLSLIHSRTQTKLVRGTPTHKHSYLEMALSLPLSYLQAHTNSN